jgi:hypothetical protein
MALLSRLWYDTLVDDDGTNTVGTIWNKASVDSLMDAVDVETHRPVCQLKVGSAIALGPGAVGSPGWDTEEIDTHNMHTGSLPTLTVPKTGLYQMGLTILWDGGNTAGRRAATFIVNGANYPPAWSTSGLGSVYGLTLQLTVLVSIVGGGSIAVNLFNDSAATAQILPESRFWVAHIS